MSTDAVAFSLMVGAGESYLAPFALALGLSDVTAGFVATVPMLAGAVLQLITPTAVGLLGSHKRWVVLCASLQAASFLPLCAIALAGTPNPVLVYATVSLYWGLGLATGPAWNTWAGSLIPARIRPRYFAHRSRLAQAAILIGLMGAGWILQQGTETGHALGAFALVFFLAFVSRTVSAWMLGRQSESRPIPLGETTLSPRSIRRHLETGEHARLLAFLLAIQCSVWIAAPYFTPYMLGHLGLDPIRFAWLTGAAFVSRICFLPALGRIARRRGTHPLFWIGTVGIVPLPVAWLVSGSLVWLFALQVLSGFVWAALELATLLAFFERIPQSARTSILSLYNLAHATAIAGGSIIGGLVLGIGDASYGAYAAVLVLSTTARLACIPMLRRLPALPRSAMAPPPMRTLSARPAAGALQKPIVAAMEDSERRVQGHTGV